MTKANIEAFLQENPQPKLKKFLGEEKDTLKMDHGGFVFQVYKHLHQLEAETTRDWVKTQNARTAAFLDDGGEIDRKTKELLQITSPQKQKREASESFYDQKGDTLFSYYNDGKSDFDQIRVRHNDGDDPVLVFDEKEYTEDPAKTASMRKVAFSPDGRHVAINISRGGADEREVYLASVDDKLQVTVTKLEHIKFGSDMVDTIVWNKDSSGFEYESWGIAEGEDKSHYRYRIMRHTLGTAPEQDQVVADLSVPFGRLERHWIKDENGELGKHNYISLHSGTKKDNGLYFRPWEETGALTELFNDGKSCFVPKYEMDGKLYAYTNHEAPRGKLVAVDIADPKPAHWQTIIPEHATDVLDEEVLFTKGHFVAKFLHDTEERVAIYDKEGTFKRDLPLPMNSRFNIKATKSGGGDIRINAYGFTYSRKDYDYSFSDNVLTLKTHTKGKFDLSDAIVETAYATSKDGTQVPMTIIRGKDTKLDGTAATLMVGYGGFNTSRLPTLSHEVSNWVKNGGIYVSTNLRGGGERGQEWYDGGRLHNKQNVFDDFAACGEHLVQKGYTQPKRLAISGGSNGGLLTLATALQRPDLFGAVISKVPVADMLIKTWASDYGERLSDKQDFITAMKYSPLHNIKKGQQYPPMLVAPGQSDDRTWPWHAYKFVARMQEQSPGSLCLLSARENQGHGSTTNEQSHHNMFEEFRFLERTLGPISQKEFARTQKADTKAELQLFRPAAVQNWQQRVREATANRTGQSIG